MPRLYIGNLPRRIEERDVKKFFREYGRIRSVDIKNGYGFVEIDDRRDADDAIHDLDGTKLHGERVTVEMARSNARFCGDRGGGDRGRDRNTRYDSRDSRDRYNSRKPIRSEHRIIVDDLSSRVSWQDLKDLMRKVGEVTFADAHKLRPNQGVVEFSNSSDMKAAIDKYDGYELYGYKLKVYEDRGGGSKRKSRSRSRSSYRRRSSSRSRGSVSKSRSRSRTKSSGKRSRSRRRSSSRKRSDSRKRSVSVKRSRSKRSTSKKSRSAKSFSKSKSPVKKYAGDNGEKKSKSRSRSASNEKMKEDSVKSKSMSREADRSISRSRSLSKSRSNSPCDRESMKSGCSDTEDRSNDNEASALNNDEAMESN